MSAAPAAPSAPAGGRRPGFAAARARLERALVASHRPGGEWREATVGAVFAALELAAADPASALVLTDRASARWRRREPEFVALVDDLALRLGRGAPPADPRLPGPRLVVLCLARQVNQRIAVGRGAQMMEIAPDLAFLALLPFVGFAEARRCVQPIAAA